MSDQIGYVEYQRYQDSGAFDRDMAYNDGWGKDYDKANNEGDKARQVAFDTYLKDNEDKIQKRIEGGEFEQLVVELISLRFMYSSQVSAYIMSNKLGSKYKNISGVLTMAKDGREWAFNGGFPPNIYARLCSRLDLNNKGSRAKVIRFKSFKKIISIS